MTHTGVVPRERLTEAQRDVLLAVRRYVKKNAIAPSYDELTVVTGVSKSTVRDTLSRLARKGYIRRAGGRYRNLVVTEKGLAA
jgi:Mn-dependent DtxR family transcriptional regulator